ncbi:leucine-rich repeat domain-containing protein [Roseivirga misakiensis]|uniref:Internalin n=1 Tax=Roseivirga misakiensis TaxID=1563681 RepID=A0A1E5SKV2_9BACT|nr:leucine-rich repeat domain-containing protein [Roseivirga misakiensis]OEJ99749.1 hypothetical protein BFP71_09280 [Roseivirga misakiensis]
MVRIKALLLIGFLTISTWSLAQTETPTDSIADPEKEQVMAMVEALEFYFNLLGSKRTTAKEKETIINQSYTKLFRDGKVQVEDDLQENRSTQIFKDVQAYLKDVDFFFQEAVFDFEVKNVERLYLPDSTPYFKAETVRNLTATGIEGDTLRIAGQRFIEFNFDKPGGDLKVVSIYTKKIDREKQLRNWWLSLSIGWKKIFQDEIGIYDDSLTTDELTRIAEMDSLDLANNDQVVSLEPIYVLTELSYLRLSNTFISDLSPLTAINSLKTLDVSNSSVYDLSVLKYHTGLEEMILFNSHVKDFTVLESFGKLRRLNLSNANGLDFSFINSLKAIKELQLTGVDGIDKIDFSNLLELEKLDLHQSDIKSLSGFDVLNDLKELNISQTSIADLAPIAQLNDLQVLILSNSQVKSITPLKSSPTIKKVYIDGLTIPEAEVNEFMDAKPETLLIKDIEELSAWWGALSEEWKTRFSEQMEWVSPPGEALVLLLNIKSLDADNAGIRTLEPVAKLSRLTYLNVSNNNIKSLIGVSKLKPLEVLKINNTNINDFTLLAGLNNLKSIEAVNTSVRSLKGIDGLAKLASLNVDGAPVRAEEVVKLLVSNDQLDVKFQTEALNSWWGGLSETMKKIFSSAMEISGTPDSDDLHALTRQSEFSINENIEAGDLSAFEKFYRLSSISLTRTGLSDLDYMPNKENIRSLSITESPLADLSSILQFKSLTSLNISNTAVNDLRPLSVLIDLQMLNCSGTNLRRLRGVESLINLQKLDCSNTSINRLDRLEDLQKLTEVICFNTRLKGNDIEGLKAALPSVKIVFY